MKRFEGIILHAVPYGETNRIVTLFTKEAGVIAAIVYRATTKKAVPGATDPLACIELVATEGKGDLYSCRDISVIRQHLPLRKRLSSLRAGWAMAQLLRKSQLPHKPAPQLYALLEGYLEQIPSFSSPEVLVQSFYLKLLRHEGHLEVSDGCSSCSSPLTECFVGHGECFCRSHAPPQAIPFLENELPIIRKLAYSRQYSELASLPFNPNLNSKVAQLTELLV